MYSKETEATKDGDPELKPVVTAEKDAVKQIRPRLVTRQASLPDGDEVVNSWNTSLFTHHVSPFLSPHHASSNTLAGSMYTASDGMRTPASMYTASDGMRTPASMYTASEDLHTPASAATQDAFRTPFGGSLTSFRRSQSSGLDYRFFASCHSRLGYMLERDDDDNVSEAIEDHARENAFNEEILKDLEQIKRVKSKGSLKNKLIRGIQAKKATSCAEIGSDRGVQIVVKPDDRTSAGSSTKVVHGILKSSVSSDSGSMGSRKAKTHQSTSWGGTKALLIEKCRMSVAYQEMCELEFAETENPYTPEELRQILSTELSVFLDNDPFSSFDESWLDQDTFRVESELSSSHHDYNAEISADSVEGSKASGEIAETSLDVEACYLREDHCNQIGALRCPNCNPSDWENWVNY